MSLQTPEHPFAEFIKILGKGKKGSRPLTQNEAYRAMHMILTGQVQPIQLGAFLMLMRIKEETSEELAGFVQAAKQNIDVSACRVQVDLDWSSYAGKRRHLPWFLLSTLLLANNGIKVFMHGAGGHTEGRIYTEKVLEILGIPVAASITEAEQQLLRYNFSYLSLAHLCPQLYDMINLRPLMGLRSPVHTLVRLLNPLNASHCLQGIFHPSYRQVHQKAALLLNQTHMAVLKGEGGETERNPDVECLVQSVHGEILDDELWPAIFTRRHLKAEDLNPLQLTQLWHGEIQDEFAEATVIATCAIALKLLGKANNQIDAHMLAEKLWIERDKQSLLLVN
ncbi:glycosyl transferase family protein [Methylomonas sp. AM2-LC]|uniref:glycosyl transferase family protein n=1 Tax=Methylomonas sp. AM2-LC TaxID=3153301 RepID=UPI003263A655